MVRRDAVTLVAIGSAIGLGVALFVMRPLALFLVADLTPNDPLSLGGVVVLLTVTAVAASWGPVRRAASVDPATTLRYD
jgi:ABC-type antimicrobial peptide transport system permease subunit